MKKSYGKGLASHPGPELCGGDRETIKGGRESLTPDDIMSRLATIGDACDSYVAHKYLTRGGIVEKDYAARGARLSCHPECDNSFSALDRFGRVVDQKWHDHGASEVRDQYRYGYDRAGNRLYRENTTTTGKDEFHGYDAINRLIAFDRGDLNAGKTAISGTPVREEDWTLDPLGNWPGYVQKTSGTTDLDQSRTHNEVNEITAIAATTGTDWADPVHDRAGNMTTLPKASSPADSLTCQYDPWNRLAQVKDGQVIVGKYEYDGQNRRVKKHFDSAAPDNPTGIDQYTHYFYNRAWQALETRDRESETAQAHNLQPKYQYVWSLRYIDAPILRDENTDQDGLCDDERLNFLGDANFNVTCVIDTAGNAAERYLYDPYGLVAIYDGSWMSTGNSSSYQNEILFTGRQANSETGLIYYRLRYFHPPLARFTSRDPIGADAHPYRYASNQPTVASDPLGLEPIVTPFSISYKGFKEILVGKLFVEPVGAPSTLKVNMHLRRPIEKGEEYRRRWNLMKRSVPGNWGDITIVEGWLWPHLYKLFNIGVFTGDERAIEGNYGYFDYVKGTWDNYAAILIRKYGKSGEEIDIGPLVSARWHAVGGTPTVSHTAGSEQFVLKPGDCREGYYRVWWVYADTFGQLGKGVPSEAAGETLAHFTIRFNLDPTIPVSQQFQVKDAGLPAPPTDFDWGEWAFKSHWKEPWLEPVYDPYTGGLTDHIPHPGTYVLDAILGESRLVEPDK